MIRFLLLISVVLSPPYLVAQAPSAPSAVKSFDTFQSDAPAASDSLPADSSNSAAELDSLWKTAEDGLFWADAEVRYQSAAALHYNNLDFWSKWAAVLFGLLAFSGPMILRASPEKKWIEPAWYIVGGLAFFIALWSTFAGYSDLRNRHAVLAEHWLSIADDWKGIEAEFRQTPVEQLKRQIEKVSIAQTTTRMAEPIEMLAPEWKNAWREESRVQQRPLGEAPSKGLPLKSAAISDPREAL
jgi:hypothetical protein